MKFILLTILATIISFFVWNSLKRIFFNKFYNHFPHQQKNNQQKQTNSQSSKKDKNVKWDAETVDYEEIED
ncbi:MAG: hypothetical protein CSA38_02850 [Flavobacteriales bacterium]|nr:MAG: hypothetical protein CSA38_02850 [Flavobacteriales bacterium]